MQPKLLCLIYIASFIAAVRAWDINKPFPNCDAGERGFSFPGIFTYTRTADGKYVIKGPNQQTVCDADICACGVVASGSFLPPKYSSFQCAGVIITSAGKKKISLPPSRSDDKLPEPHVVCCDRSFYGLIKAGCNTYN
ncbi:hypothetical protein K457DRAFT_21812 [Linnemannia elongata AG-77]|uniref:Uncharacterized protein n=1 Tax=Linnemannia elongata AG-77 TaxID=1314771 RepID=A0A197JR61_9FUNG|nr:hypothetical protein K457DRAFT_21812 [Linnemannia elongata AG-77]